MEVSKDSVMAFIGYVRECGFQFSVWERGEIGFNAMHDPILSLAKSLAPEKPIDKQVTKWIIRFSPTGRLRLFDTDCEIYFYLLGIRDAVAEQAQATPFLAEFDGDLIIDEGNP